MAETTIPVEHLFSLELDAGKPNGVKGGPKGDRLIFEVPGGSFTGERLKGTVVPPGGDWATLRADGTVHLDVRLILITDDDEKIYMEYTGIVKDGSARSAPMFQTGSAKYAWLNSIQAVGIGKAEAGKVTYEVYAVL